MQTEVYVFSSSRLHHIALAVEHGIWKVRCAETQERQLFGKAEASIIPGNLGIFYDSILNQLSVPFVFTSYVEYTSTNEPFAPIEDEPYRFQFTLSPLGPRSQSIAYDMIPQSIKKAVNPVLVFQPCNIDNEEWLRIFETLKYPLQPTETKS